jgi:hypothetical protein
MNKLPFETKNIQLNALIDRINYLLDKVVELENKEPPVKEIPAVVKQAMVRKNPTKAKS